MRLGLKAGYAGLGLAYGEVRLVVDAHGEWQPAAGRLADDLRAALGPDAVAVEHVGSTAVPGLAAKPILDFAVGLTPDAVVERAVSALERAGFLFRGDAGEEGGLVFVLETQPRHRVAHVHVVRYGDRQWRRYVAVRDRLRADATARQAYAELKSSLAERFRNDRRSYTAGKAEFIAVLAGDE